MIGVGYCKHDLPQFVLNLELASDEDKRDLAMNYERMEIVESVSLSGTCVPCQDTYTAHCAALGVEP